MKLSVGNPAEQRKQIGILAVLLIVAAVVLYYQFGGPTAEVLLPASNAAAAPTGIAVPAGALPEPLRLASLEPVPEDTASLRNPFGFGVPPRPPAPPPPPPAPPRPTPTPTPVRTGPPPRPHGHADGDSARGSAGTLGPSESRPSMRRGGGLRGTQANDPTGVVCCAAA